MIKVTGKRAVRSTTAPYITEDGEITEIAVEYYSSTTAMMKDRRERAIKRAKDAKPTDIAWHTEELAEDIHGLIDKDSEPLAGEDGKALFTPCGDRPQDEKGKKFKEWKPLYDAAVAALDKLDIRNVNAIRQAIEDDIAAKKSQPGE